MVYLPIIGRKTKINSYSPTHKRSNLMERLMCIHNFILSTTILLILTFGISQLNVNAEISHKTLTINATDQEKWVYFSLSESDVVDIKDPTTSLKWDIGFKRTAIITNGGINGPGESATLILTDTSFESVDVAPEGDYISDTDQIATFARGDGWYTYTGPPNHWILVNEKIYILRTAEGNYAKLRFIGYYENNDAKEGSGHISFEYVLQKNGTRFFIDTPPADVNAIKKLTITWAEVKKNR